MSITRKRVLVAMRWGTVLFTSVFILGLLLRPSWFTHPISRYIFADATMRQMRRAIRSVYPSSVDAPGPTILSLQGWGGAPGKVVFCIHKQPPGANGKGKRSRGADEMESVSPGTVWLSGAGDVSLDIFSERSLQVEKEQVLYYTKWFRLGTLPDAPLVARVLMFHPKRRGDYFYTIDYTPDDSSSVDRSRVDVAMARAVSDLTEYLGGD